MKLLSKLFAVVLLAVVLVVCVAIIGKKHNEGSSASISKVVINEVMSKNTETCPDENNEYFDWIEIYNSNPAPVDISGCGLSDDITGTVKYVFPRNTTIEKNGYLVIYCAGTPDMGDYYASFKLSTKDNVVFYNQSGNPVECINLKSVGDGKSLARISPDSADFTEMSPTPGFSNDSQGIAAYADFMTTRASHANTSDSEVVINEFMSQNATTLRASDGGFYDWVELYNKSDRDISISGWHLSDNADNREKFTFADGAVIKANEYLIVFCSGKESSENGEIHAPFSLNAYQESVVLSDADGKILDKIVYQRQKADLSMARNDDGQFEETEKPTPGYPNTQAGYEEFSRKANIPTSALYISEVLGSNSTVALTTANGNKIYPDFIELYNSSDEDINLEGYALSNTPKNPAKWIFPNVTVKSGDTITVLATSANTSDNSIGYYQANFSVSSDGDTVYLYSPEAVFLDKLHADKFYCNMSIGRNSKLETLMYTSPSPGSKNSEKGYKGFTDTPSFSITPGIYDESSLSVELLCSEGETVYYTTDCTTPTNKSKKYTGQPINISSNTVIRAITYRSGYYNGYSCASGTYLLKKDDVNHALPVVTLVTDPANLWDGDTGIYAYGNTVDLEDDTWPYWQTNANFWKDIEVPAYFEVFGDDTGKEVFGQNIGINISGAFGQGREQKGFAITARDEYGSNRMKYRFFDTPNYTEYKSLLLRCGAQDQANGKIRDVLSAGLLRGSDVNFLYQEYKPYVLYLNGKYWGVYFMREKRNRFFVAQHENLGLENADKLTLIKSETRANYGSVEEWAELMNFVRTHDITDNTNYKYLTDRLDVDSFTDYIICEIYVANTDYWNIQMYKTESGKWKFIYYDFCWGWGNPDHNTLAARRADAQPCSDLFNALLKRNDYREKFIRRFAEIMDSVFDEDKVFALIDELYGQVQPEIERERRIFNSADSPYFDYVDPENYSTYKTFETHIERIRTFAQKRRAVVTEQLKSAFGSTNSATLKEVFG